MSQNHFKSWESELSVKDEGINAFICPLPGHPSREEKGLAREDGTGSSGGRAGDKILASDTGGLKVTD